MNEKLKELTIEQTKHRKIIEVLDPLLEETSEDLTHTDRIIDAYKEEIHRVSKIGDVKMLKATVKEHDKLDRAAGDLKITEIVLKRLITKASKRHTKLQKKIDKATKKEGS